MILQRPPSLKPGDKVAIISPSSGLPHIFPLVYEQGYSDGLSKSSILW